MPADTRIVAADWTKAGDSAEKGAFLRRNHPREKAYLSTAHAELLCTTILSFLYTRCDKSSNTENVMCEESSFSCANKRENMKVL